MMMLCACCDRPSVRGEDEGCLKVVCVCEAIGRSTTHTACYGTGREVLWLKLGLWDGCSS